MQGTKTDNSAGSSGGAFGGGLASRSGARMGLGTMTLLLLAVALAASTEVRGSCAEAMGSQILLREAASRSWSDVVAISSNRLWLIMSLTGSTEVDSEPAPIDSHCWAEFHAIDSNLRGMVAGGLIGLPPPNRA